MPYWSLDKFWTEKGRNNFIGQVINTVSYFRSVDSLVQHKLFLIVSALLY